MVNNGAMFTCHRFDEWAYGYGIRVDFIRPGQLAENGYIGTFSGKLRDECLSDECFLILADTRQVVGTWRRDCSEQKLHSSLSPLASE